MRSARWIALAPLALCAALLGADPGAGAAASCGYQQSTVTISQQGGEGASLRVGSSGEILLNGTPCGEATTANTTAIEVSGAGEVRVDLRGQSFGNVPIDVALTGGHGVVRVLGSSRSERMTLRGSTIELDPAEGGQVTTSGVDRVAVDASGGRDEVDAGDHDGPVALSGGTGDDALTGGRAGDVLHGGPSADRLRGGSGGDRLFGGSGPDSLSGGAGRDRIHGDAGDDVCWGGADRDRLFSCTTPFRFDSSKIDARTRERMTGVSWHHGCPVAIGDLRLVTLRFWDFDGDVQRGELVLNRDAVAAIRTAMRSLYDHRFPFRRMRPIDAYGGDDHRSMAADNTSAFNCRYIAGQPGVWSQHAYGRAIDIDTIENPYVTSSGYVSPPAGRAYADRSRHAPGMIHSGDATTRAFAAVGWEWGGDWPWPKDYQHFSANGH